MTKDIAHLKKWFANNREMIFSDYFRFLQFKSISTDSAYSSEILACAKWLQAYLHNIGMKAELWATSKYPVVFAEHKAVHPDSPTLLIYHHYDVQPVDPLSLWKSDPFQPVIKQGRVYARGAQDNKGQCSYTLTALKAFLTQSKPADLNIKIFIEGEEETGSEGTEEAIEKYQARLKADYLMVIDSNIPRQGVPGITLGVRGIATGEIICKNSRIDLHSGSFGGIAYNPNRALAAALTTLWDEQGRVKVPHFYDEVENLTAEEKQLLDLSYDEQGFLSEFGIRAFSPEPGFTIRETNWLRPTIEINGMSGGYTGEGFKTVLPAQASAKISCRLVPNQDPQKIYQRVAAYLCKQFPKGFEVSMHFHHGGPAFRGNFHSIVAKTAAIAYEEVLNMPCKQMLSGGSIPIVSKLVSASKAEALLMGYGLDEDNIHAPNEHFGLDRFEQGFLTVGRILALLSEKR